MVTALFTLSSRRDTHDGINRYCRLLYHWNLCR
jgi:hypothetical protein